MKVYVFTGPSLPPTAAREVFDGPVYLPPAAAGDVYRAASERPDVIGIIDGYFEAVPAIWHKEILHALSQGIHVLGASSMGALRAAELEPFGMQGVGTIFEAFHHGYLEDDDEVAVLHGPAEIGYPLLSEAMVNIRRTLSDACAEGIIGKETRRTLETIAKKLFYPERCYAAILGLGQQAGVTQDELTELLDWLPAGRIDQKREDALLLLRSVRRLVTRGSSPGHATFHFECTTIWDRLVRSANDTPKNH